MERRKPWQVNSPLTTKLLSSTSTKMKPKVLWPLLQHDQSIYILSISVQYRSIHTANRASRLAMKYILVESDVC